MSLPLNGFCPSEEHQPPSYSPEVADSPIEEWPDWSGPDGDETGDGQSVRIHIETSDRAEPPGSGLTLLSPSTVEEEPWDDFEDTEATSDLSPVAHTTDRVLVTPPTEGAATLVKQTCGPPRSADSKPLKLTLPQQPSEGKSAAYSTGGWAQQKKAAEKSSGATHSKTEKTVPQWNSQTYGLGEEFTIKVKKKVEQDPELDLFADMVPDIQLSSPAQLQTKDSERTSVAKLPEVNTAVDAATLTAKFAAADLPEVSVCELVAHCSSTGNHLPVFPPNAFLTSLVGGNRRLG